MARTPVFLKHETPFAQPATHSATSTLVGIVLANRSGKIVKKETGQALWLTTEESWRELKDRLRPSALKGVLIPRLKAPSRPINLDLAYPEAGRETVRHPHQAMIDQCLIARREKASAQALGGGSDQPA